jgi:hypothetical protein
MQKEEQPVQAYLVIRDAAGMNEAKRKEVADWLRHQAEELIVDGNAYATRYKAILHR